MTELEVRIKEIEKELETLPAGYISKKKIGGKDRFYLQWTENGKLKSRYIKADEYEAAAAQAERRRELQKQLKALKKTPEGAQIQNRKRKTARSVQSITGCIMSGNKVAAKVKNGEITEFDEAVLPLYLKRTKDVEGWLASRAIDAHRTNSRLLKRALRLRAADDAQVALAVSAATVTDRYWFRPEGSTARYDDIRFKENLFDTLALRGDPDAFSLRPSRTPELTNTGSYEKCWRLIDGEWWMYKSGNENEHFSELFLCLLGERIGLPFAHYEMDGEYIRTKDFTNGAAVNFEPISALMDDNNDYSDCFDAIFAISPELAGQYLRLVWFDTVCYNMDRHTANFGFLRDAENGKILSMAPNFDNNIALIARGYPSDVSRAKDGIIALFREFLQRNETAREMLLKADLPQITEEILDECLKSAPFNVDGSFIKAFILNGQEKLCSILRRFQA